MQPFRVPANTSDAARVEGKGSRALVFDRAKRNLALVGAARPSPGRGGGCSFAHARDRSNREWEKRASEREEEPRGLVTGVVSPETP